jgi:RHS repeat-associated protein
LVFQTSCGTAYVYFRGKLVRKESPPALQDGVWVDQRGVTMGTDRLGSVLYWENMATTSYYPYGEEETPTWNDKQKFATYTRDSATGMDYAQNRYYASQIGRFTTADPYRASAKRASPQSWNRYVYVQGDPISANDPSGLDCDFVGVGGLTIGDPGSACGGPSIGWGDDDDPGGSVNSCTQAAFFGIAGCGGGGSSGPGGSAAAQLLHCSYDGAIGGNQISDGGYVAPSFYIPVWFDFTASGGTGTYTWGDEQTVQQSGGVVDWDGSKRKPHSAVRTILKEHLAYDAPSSTQAEFRDAPGISMFSENGSVITARIIMDFTFQAKVTSGGVTVNCPTVYWSVTILWPEGAAEPTLYESVYTGPTP